MSVPHALKELFGWLDPAESQATAAAREHMATAVLLVEVMRSDRELSANERAMAVRVLRRLFGPELAEPAQLLQQAEDASRHANDFFAFTSVLNERMPQPRKIDVVEGLWQVAYCDGRADAGEMHTISKVAGLLHVTHGEYIAAKLRAKQAAGLPGT